MLNHLSQQFWGPGGRMFHVSPSETRESIAKYGLLPRNRPEHPEERVEMREGAKARFANEGTFLSEEPHTVGSDFDIYAVDTDYLPYLKDEALAMDRVRRSVYVPGSISPDRVQRIKGEEREKLIQAMSRSPWKNPFQEEK